MFLRLPPRLQGLLLTTVGLISALPLPAGAAPQINKLSLHGLRSGGTTTLTIEGADLLPAPRVLLSVPIAEQAVKDGATSDKIEIEVTLAADVAPGIYHLRLANAKGISRAVPIGIDDLPELPMRPSTAELPVALHGSISGNQIARTSFDGRAGQRIVVEVDARRLGSAIDPIIELYDSDRILLEWAQSKEALSGDARIETTLPRDGQYHVELHDVLYRAASPNHFRLKIGDLYYADMVYPLGGQRGTQVELEMIGALPSDLRAKADLSDARGAVAALLPNVPNLSGPSPRVLVSDYPEFTEAETVGDELQEISVPAVINGRIDAPGQEDSFRLLVKPGAKVRFDVTANRAGSPLDGVLTLRNAEGAPLANNDDRGKIADPGFDYTVPEGVTSVTLVLSDLQGRGGPSFIYRIAVTPLGRPDFSLQVFQDRYHVSLAGATVLRVRANRSGYNGPIKLTFEGLPEGISVSGDEIPAGVSETLVTLSGFGLRAAQGLVSLRGEATEEGVSLRREALVAANTATRMQPWLRRDVGVAVTGPGTVGIAWDTSEPWLPKGVNYPARVRVTRAEGASGPVRLALVTSQVVPQIAQGLNRGKPDNNRALRLEGTPTIAAEQTSGVAQVIVPGDLAEIPYDVAIRAELLSADGKNVVATAVTPARRLRARRPFSVALSGPAQAEAKAGLGATGKLSGKVARLAGFERPVTVTLSGLPTGLPAPLVVVPPGQSAFELPVSFPFGSKAGPLADVKLVAVYQSAPDRVVQSNEIPVAVTVVAGEAPPPPGPLYRVFEDEPYFLGMLHEGNGKVSLETADRYSGSAALRVTPPQRFRASVPNWNYKITENPGESEFRYLRFAWKKQGGQNILLQLNAGGAWGASQGSEGKGYRYEAGPGANPFGLKAIKVDEKLPADWVVVTRDLFADFGEFTLTGLAFTPGPGQYALFDHLYLARSEDDLKACPPPVAK